MANALQQEELGDPSGQSSSEYWDEWFQKVSPDEGFEWYCDASEIARILLRLEGSSSNTKEDFVIFHPGSGNSAVPFRLCEDYGVSINRICSKQCIMDCSAIAVEQMMKKGGPLGCCRGIIEYHVGDVLQPPLPYLDQTFDAWIDKGLVDALFCGENILQEKEQCATLFQEAHRVLKQHGICIIASLAQDHTVDLILHASGWINHHEGNSIAAATLNTSHWLEPIEIHEVKPLSDASSLRPFVVVLRNGPSDELEETNCTSLSHSESSTIPAGDQRPILVFFDQNGIVRSSISKNNFSFEAVRNMVQTSQREYLDQWNANKINKCDNSIYYGTDEDMFYVLAKIHIKPWDVDTNLQELKERIKSNTEYTTLFQGLVWKTDEIKGIGFGIHSLQMSLVIPQACLEELCECIATEEEEFVQSVDIDWESTCRVFTNTTALPISTKC